jgi:hypothetical protein
LFAAALTKNFPENIFMQFIFICFCFIALGCSSSAQVYPLSPVRMSLAGSGLAGKSGVFSTENPAAAAFLSGPLYTFSFQESYFVKELSLSSFSVAVPAFSGTFGGRIQHQGYDAYGQLRLGAAFSRKFGDKCAAGIQADLRRLSIRHYGAVAGVSFLFSVLFEPSEKLRWSVLAENPFAWRLKKGYSQTWPVSVSGGLAYLPNQKTEVFLDAFISTVSPAELRAGLRYHFTSGMYVMAGWSSGPETAAFGFDCGWKKMRFIMAAAFHRYLGVSPQSMLYYAEN